jgi:hypothetical protein
MIMDLLVSWQWFYGYRFGFSVPLEKVIDRPGGFLISKAVPQRHILEKPQA